MKAMMICPFCDDPRAFTWAGCLLHVKAKHPKELSELRDNKAMYLEKFACDEMGNPLAAATHEPDPSQQPEPSPEPTPTPTPEPKKPPAPEVTPPDKKEKPAEGGGFLDILKEAVDGLPG